MAAAAPSSDALEARTRRLGVIAAIAAISVAGMGFGHSIPLFSVLLERAGASGTENGGAAAAGALAVIFATPFYPRVIRRTGLRPFLLLSVAVMVASYAAIYAVREVVWAWYPIRFLFSMGASGMFVGSEVWINGAATRETRGRLIGLYSTCLAGGFFLGPVLLEQTGYDGSWPFVVGGLVFASAALPILLATAPAADPEEDRDVRVFPLLRTAPVTFGASTVFGAVESALLVFIPLMVLAAGFGEGASARSVAVYGLGLLAMQYLLGWAASRFGIMRMLTFCALSAAAMAALVPVSDDRLLTLFPVLFFLGGMVQGISTVGLVLLGDRFEGPKLAAASTGYATAWGLGAVLGPVVAGGVRDAAGFDAVFAGLVVVLGLYAAATVARRRAAFP